jgi:hypothetical protein
MYLKKKLLILKIITLVSHNPSLFLSLMKTMIWFIFGSLIFSVDAKNLDLKKVSDDSNWIMHMNFDSMRSSEIGKFIQEAYENIPAVQSKIQKAQGKYGIDIMETSNLTMFGSGERHRGIGILEGGVDASIVSEFARSKDSIEESRVGENTIFSNLNGRRPMAFSTFKKSKLVFGTNPDYVAEGIFLSEGKETATIEHPVLESLEGLLDEPGFLFFANVKGAMDVVELDERVQLMVDKIDSAGMVIGEQQSGLMIIGLVQVNSIEMSEPMENMIRAGLAMMEMKLNKNDQLDGFLKGYQVTSTGSQIRVEMELSIPFIIERIKEEMKKSV